MNCSTFAVGGTEFWGGSDRWSGAVAATKALAVTSNRKICAGAAIFGTIERAEAGDSIQGFDEDLFIKSIRDGRVGGHGRFRFDQKRGLVTQLSGRVRGSVSRIKHRPPTIGFSIRRDQSWPIFAINAAHRSVEYSA